MLLQTSIDLIKENGFTLKKTSRQYPAETMTEADYTNDLALLTNTTDQAKSLWHNLEQAEGGNGLYINATKTEFMCFKKKPFPL